MDLEMGVPADELRGFVLESYRHFASRRAVALLDSQPRVA
jgi:hypothetical protein